MDALERSGLKVGFHPPPLQPAERLRCVELVPQAGKAKECQECAHIADPKEGKAFHQRKVKLAKTHLLAKEGALRYLENSLNSAKDGVDENGKVPECPICFDVIEKDDLCLTPCGHMFHIACIQDCVDNSAQNCPTCRHPVTSNQLTIVKERYGAEASESEERGLHGSKIIAIRDKLREIHAQTEEVHGRERPVHDRSIVFIQWKGLLNKTQQALSKAGIEALTLQGGVFQRAEILAQFAKQRRGVLLLSLESSPSGMNLIHANHCLLVHPMSTDNADTAIAWERQAIGRICRQGQEKKCHIYRFMTADTVEAELFARQHGGGEVAAAAPEPIAS